MLRRSILISLAIAFTFFLLWPGSASAEDITPAKVTNFAVGVDATSTEVYGHRPVDTRIVVENISSETRPFTATVWYGGYAWGGEMYPYTSTINSDVYWSQGDHNSITYSWKGTLEPNERAEFYIRTFTGLSIGTFKFVVIDIQEPFQLHVERNLTVTQGSGELKGTIKTMPNNNEWQAGEWRQFIIEVESPVLTQFKVQGMQSTCPMTLPTFATSSTNRTWHEFYSGAFQLPADTVAGSCIMTATIESLWTNQVFSVQREFTVTPPEVVPPLPRIDVWSTIAIQLGKIAVDETFTMTVVFGNNGTEAAQVWEIAYIPERHVVEDVLQPGETVQYQYWPKLGTSQVYWTTIDVQDGVDDNPANNTSIMTAGVPPQDEMPILQLELLLPALYR